MSIPDVPSVFKQPTPAERPWWWKLVDESGEEVSVDEEFADQRFTNQGDAESWVGEVWEELLEAGVAAVVLFENDREVYGPMKLSA
ncbi:hypothetical protein FB381_1934 [Nocardioides albertanoniae]|uniref:Uncharacterized protein n=1 Tax=Nocardioides albertanoniae TaxID=1175486 RepID=A0A543A623_9ACTN|nr:hypothetical protein [Nocardioides albertanoniae]TQL68045.1 hypothetical protein FB381_1934 [Nocardioides albertanoniae]